MLDFHGACGILLAANGTEQDMLTQKDKLDIAAEYERGIRPKEIALRYGISQGYATAIARGLGVRMQPIGCPLGSRHKTKSKPVNVRRNREMWELRKNGLSLQKIGEMHGITREAVRQVLKMFPSLPNPSRETLPRDKIKALAVAGLTRKEIARKTMIPYESVCMVAKKMGLAVKRGTHFKHDYGKIVAMWNSSLSLRKMAKNMGTTWQVVGTLVHRLRERGYDLPFRRKMAGERRNS